MVRRLYPDVSSPSPPPWNNNTAGHASFTAFFPPVPQHSFIMVCCCYSYHYGRVPEPWSPCCAFDMALLSLQDRVKASLGPLACLRTGSCDTGARSLTYITSRICSCRVSSGRAQLEACVQYKRFGPSLTARLSHLHQFLTSLLLSAVYLALATELVLSIFVSLRALSSTTILNL